MINVATNAQGLSFISGRRFVKTVGVGRSSTGFWTRKIMDSILLERYLTGMQLFLVEIIFVEPHNVHCAMVAHEAQIIHDFRPLRTREEEHSFIYGDVMEDLDQFSKDTKVTLDWSPPGVSTKLVSKYLKSLGEDFLPIQGSDAAVRRIKQLEKQFPLHDVEPEKCHQLSPGEIDRFGANFES